MGLHLISDAVTFALPFMVTYYGAHCGQRIILKEHPSCVIQSSSLQQSYCFRDIGMYGTAFLTKGLLASQTLICFIKHMKSHNLSSSYPIHYRKNGREHYRLFLERRGYLPLNWSYSMSQEEFIGLSEVSVAEKSPVGA